MTVTKLSISLNAEQAEEIRAAAAAAGLSVSAWVAEAIRPRLRSEALRRYLEEYQEEFGAFTEEEIEQADIALGFRAPASQTDAAG